MLSSIGRNAYTAGDEAIRAQMPTLVTPYDEVWDALCLICVALTLRFLLPEFGIPVSPGPIDERICPATPPLPHADFTRGAALPSA